MRTFILAATCAIVLGLTPTACAQETADREGVPVPENASFDYGPLQALYDTYVDELGNVDYAGLKANRAELDVVVAQFAAARPETFADRNARFAFWINAYNLMTITGVVDAYPTKSVKDIKLLHGFFSRIDFHVAGRTLTLNDIEHKILREQFRDPRLHFTIVCASASCPRLNNQVYRPETLDVQLEAAAKEFLNTPSKNTIDPATGSVKLSKIFDWFEEDFTAEAGSVQAFAARYLPADAAAAAHNARKLEFLTYDWSLNDQHPR